MLPEQLEKIVGKKNNLSQICDALNATFEKYQINTPLRQAHFLAQVIHESGNFVYTSEIWGKKPTLAQENYDTRTDLGNTPEKDGDGFKFRGRGWIQVTGKANYTSISKDLGQDFVKNPDLLAQYPYAAISAGWFWGKRKLNELADKDSFTIITKKINGGTNGIDDRLKWLRKCKEVLIG